MGSSRRRAIGSALWLLLATHALAAIPPDGPHPRHDPRPGAPLSELSSPLVRGFAFNDLDGDGVADLIAIHAPTLHSRQHLFRVSVQSSAQKNTAFNIESDVPNGFHIAIFDVDHDRDLDIVITAGFRRQVVGVWINNGAGIRR